ncbi:uncharacterized protein LOC116293003 [Actinia tenebrosa]|uniref:Uncharacterized protein LOC116293003 n=1 Tax=Actinia tenebrosa TaxID=6105 RepID=A0A6P8HUH0_ACTTE|nr:uncharacterized protein LOC116293003 [Actinia tenebrosa]
MEKLLETEKGADKPKRLHSRRRTFLGIARHTKTPKRSLSGNTEYAGGILTKTPVNRSCSVRKPLQVVSATKASNSSFFSITRKDKSAYAAKMFGTKMMEPVVKSKTPVAFTTPKPQGSFNVPCGKPESTDGCIFEGRQLSESLGSSSDDFRNSFNDGEKPFILQSLLGSRKSKKLDFIVKDSKISKSAGMNTNHDKMSSASSETLITRTSASSSTIPKASVSSVVAESTASSVIAKSSPSSSTNSSVSPVITDSSSSMITKASISSCTITSCTTSKRMRVDENIKLGLASDLPVITSTLNNDTKCKQSSINQGTLHTVHDEADEDKEFSNSVFSETVGKKDSKAFNKDVESNLSRAQNSSVCSVKMENKNVKKPERNKLKVSRRSAGSSRKALQEARLQGLKNNFKNTTQDFETCSSVSLTPSPADAAEIPPSSPLETEIFCTQKSTPSPTGNDIDKVCVSKSETQSQSSSSSTTSSQSLESSTKTNKDWMHLFEEPFPRRSPRLSSLPASTAKDYEYLMDNFSPLTSRMRSKGRKKQPRTRSSQKKKKKGEDADNHSVPSKEAKMPVSPLVLAEKETAPPILQTSASENDAKTKEESLKRPKTEKPDNNILSKKKSNVSINQTSENDSLVPSATSLHLSQNEKFCFPRPPAILSCPRGPYSMIVDFALPDKDYAKLKLAKIKGNQARKKATMDYEETSSHCDLRKKEKLNKNLVNDKDKVNESFKTDEEITESYDGSANAATNIVDSTVNNKETRGIREEREMNAIPRDISDKNESQSQKKDTLYFEVEDDNGFIPATPKTKTDLSITTVSKSNDNLSEERFTQYSDSDNTLSGSILQNLQASSIIDNNTKPEKGKSLDSPICSKNKHLDNIVTSTSLVRNGPGSPSIPQVEKGSPELLKVPLKQQKSLCLQNHLEESRKCSQNRGRSSPLEKYKKSIEIEMKGNENGITCEKLPLGKECVPSSQGSTASQSPNDLKGLLFLNGSVEKNSHPIPLSNNALSSQNQQKGQQGGSETLDDSENTSVKSISLESKRNLDVVQDSIRKDVQKIDDALPWKQEDTKLVGGLEVTNICSDKEGLLSQEKCILGHVNDVTDHLSNHGSKTLEVLACRSENFEMVSAANQITVSQPCFNKTLSFSLGDTGKGSSVNEVAESHFALDSLPSSFLHDTEMGSIVNQESKNSEYAQNLERNIKNPLDISTLLCSNTEEFDNTPGSIKGTMPLYSNPEECNEQPADPDCSFPLCPDTEEFSHAVDVPSGQNTGEFGIVESESLEPSIGDTATPHGKASVPQGSSVMDIESACQAENSILTPVLMQACLQHENSESNKVLSISMSTYDSPGHVVKKRDVIAVCLSHWVVLWIKMGGQEWTVLKSWTLDNTDCKMFQMVKFLPVISHLVLFVGGRFASANGRVYGYSDTTSYDFQLEYEDACDDLMSFSSMCVLNEKEQCINSTASDVELVVAGETASGPVVSKWSLDCHCLDVKKHQALTLPDGSGAITSLCTVDGNCCLLVGSTGAHLLLWNLKRCDLLKEINLSRPGLHNFDCLQAATEMGLLFLTMCQRSATQKDKFESDASPCLLYALNPLNNTFKCLKHFPHKELTSSPKCSSVFGQYLALGCQDGMAWLVNMAAPHHWATFPVFQGAIESISFHPNRPILAFGGGKNACVHVYSLS